MGAYKVLKDFPSRNGVKQYYLGETIQLNKNSRTKALVEMGYIESLPAQDLLIMRIAKSVYKLEEVTAVKIQPCGRRKNKNYYKMEVEE